MRQVAQYCMFHMAWSMAVFVAVEMAVGTADDLYLWRMAV